MKNIIILTPGLSGSSLLASLLVKAGYWQGDKTDKKLDYDTFENSGLVDINRAILIEAGIGDCYQTQFDSNWFEVIKSIKNSGHQLPLQQFYQQCNEQPGWLWKDPRLWLTLGLWQEVIDSKQVKFILLHRDLEQLWVSCIKRRQIQSKAFCQHYDQQVCEAIRQQVSALDGELLELCFEDLLLTPEESLSRLNDFLGAQLTVDDLAEAYKGRLGQRVHNRWSYLQALMIYLKNYSQRYR